MTFELSELQAVTDEYYENTSPVDIYFEDSVLLYILMSGGMFQESLIQAGETADGGEKIRAILEIGESHSGTYGDTTKIPLSKKDILNAARFDWCGYYGANGISLKERVRNSGKAAIVELAFAKISNMQKTIRDAMGAAVYAARGTDPDAMNGLADLFNTNASTAYGSLTQADVPKWKANVYTGTATTIGLSMMQKVRRAAKVGQGVTMKPNLYLTTDEIKDGFERTLTPQMRYAANDKIANAGFDNVLFGGQPVVADDKQASGYLHALNTRFIKLKTHKDFQFTKPKWEYGREQPDAFNANIRWVGGMITTHRGAHCLHTDVEPPA